MQNSVITNQAIDVKEFCIQITESYNHFSERVHRLIGNLPTYSPETILSECNLIKDKQNKLSILDEQMITIVQLVGNEIDSEPFIADYRNAFHSAATACDKLYEQLTSLKTALSSAQPIGQVHH